jgi:RND family efflux transporter MFP subunit
MAVGLSAGALSTALAGGLACVIKPSAEVAIASPVEGLIQTVPVERGDWVTRGQVVAMLESSLEESTVALAKGKAEQEAAIKSSQAKIAFSGRKLDRALDLFKSNSIARHEVDEAETEKILAEMSYLEAKENKLQAELELQRATAALRLRTIHSPINGLVVERFLAPGELARQAPIMKLVQIDPLRVEVFAPLTLLGKVTPGMKAVIRPDANEQTTYAATVTVVNRVVDSASGTFGVRLEMPNPDKAIPAGLPCTLDFQPS